MYDKGKGRVSSTTTRGQLMLVRVSLLTVLRDEAKFRKLLAGQICGTRVVRDQGTSRLDQLPHSNSLCNYTEGGTHH